MLTSEAFITVMLCLEIEKPKSKCCHVLFAFSKIIQFVSLHLSFPSPFCTLPSLLFLFITYSPSSLSYFYFFSKTIELH